MDETAIGDGSILSGLAWLVVSLAFLLIVATVAAIVLFSIWRGGDAFAWVKSSWAWLKGFFSK